MPKQTSKRTRCCISNSQKAALRTQHQLKPQLTNIDLIKWFEATYNQRITPSSVSRILSPRCDYLDAIPDHRLNDKRRRTELWPELEAAVIDWLERAQSYITISQEVIREKAKQYWPIIYPDKMMPSFSNGWLRGFQYRKNIKNFKQYGEGREITLENDVEDQMILIRKALRVYAPCDIFNCDKTGLYWRMPPDRGLSTRSIPGLKKDKARISIHFCCNADASERLPLWFIGAAKKPRVFQAAGINPENLGCKWRSNRRSWMTTAIFKEWLLWFDQRMVGRQVALLCANFSSHLAAYEEVKSQLSNTLIIWLPPNSTSRYQPLDQGIIRTWKAYWKRQWLVYMMTEYDRGYDPITTMNLLQALRWSISAWNLDLKDDTIRHCFTRALSDDTYNPMPDSAILHDLTASLQKLRNTARIQDMMHLDQFLNPLEEQVHDATTDIDDVVLSQYTAVEDEVEEDDEMIEPLPIISSTRALQALHDLRLYEEQQNDANQASLHSLACQERDILRRKVLNTQQSDIRGYFR
ncbi:uncharacterized protein AKAW2_40268S [Aspergillus luchuensis]|uniref:Jerky n=1 Tax=Aspergillus kawachii TaxID=1069201 RepID=A0A146F3Z7_ASPKA|nr:uncharacterized protein AKAW2_40268S [Aspergillus luchuensis]BCR98585.1 hypothetical protein AKAW2_40268S [Aspergillus luchuensis]GAA92412.1 jerky [Aspergillus luchuensis IFO 4308]GAT20828.1 jerky [Aspergillus luchuensis]